MEGSRVGDGRGGTESEARSAARRTDGRCSSAGALAPVAFLIEEYEPRCYLFAVVEAVRRVLLTGVLAVFANGGALQIGMCGRPPKRKLRPVVE